MTNPSNIPELQQLREMDEAFGRHVALLEPLLDKDAELFNTLKAILGMRFIEHSCLRFIELLSKWNSLMANFKGELSPAHAQAIQFVMNRTYESKVKMHEFVATTIDIAENCTAVRFKRPRGQNSRLGQNEFNIRNDLMHVPSVTLSQERFEEVSEFVRRFRSFMAIVCEKLIKLEEIDDEGWVQVREFERENVLKAVEVRIVNDAIPDKLQVETVKGGLPGFIPVSEIDDSAPPLTCNQTIKTIVVPRPLDMACPEPACLEFGIRRLTIDPWATILDKFEIGHKISGKVAKLTKVGAFVEFDSSFEAFADISQLREERVEKVEDIIRPGDKIETRVIKIDATERLIYLSLKAANYGEAELLKESESFVPTRDPDAIERSSQVDQMFASVFEDYRASQMK